MIPIRQLNRTTNGLIWWADSPNAWEPSVWIGPPGCSGSAAEDI